MSQSGVSYEVLNDLIARRMIFQMVPSPAPSIVDNALNLFITSPQTSLMDINARLSNAILKTKVD